MTARVSAIQWRIFSVMCLLAVGLAFLSNWPVVLGVLIGGSVGIGLIGHMIKEVTRNSGGFTPTRKLRIGSMAGYLSPVVIVACVLVAVGHSLGFLLALGVAMLALVVTSVVLLSLVRRMSMHGDV